MQVKFWCVADQQKNKPNNHDFHLTDDGMVEKIDVSG
jgi:hypothetical protein